MISNELYLFGTKGQKYLARWYLQESVMLSSITASRGEIINEGRLFCSFLACWITGLVTSWYIPQVHQINHFHTIVLLRSIGGKYYIIMLVVQIGNVYTAVKHKYWSYAVHINMLCYKFLKNCKKLLMIDDLVHPWCIVHTPIITYNNNWKLYVFIDEKKIYTSIGKLITTYMSWKWKRIKIVRISCLEQYRRLAFEVMDSISIRKSEKLYKRNRIIWY